MTTANLDAADLRRQPAGGLVRENVLDQIFDISRIPLPFTDRAGSAGDVTQQYHEWTVDKLRDPDMNNWKVDGQDTITANDTNMGTRLGNHCGISTKTVQVSTRANNSDVIGVGQTLSYQVEKRNQELRRDVEALSLGLQGSVEDDGDTIPGKVGSVFSFIKTNVDLGATGTATGFNTTTKVTATVVPGTKRGLTETIVRNQVQNVYLKGGEADTFMAPPQICRIFSEYCFTSQARIATLMNDEGGGPGPMRAKGSVNVFESDFGTLAIVPNRLMQPTATGTGSIGIFDFDYLAMGQLVPYRIEQLAKTGLADKRQIAVDWTLEVRNEEAEAAIHAIDYTVAVVF